MSLNLIRKWSLGTAILFGMAPSFLSQNSQPKSRADWQQFTEMAREAYKRQEYSQALLYYQNATLNKPKNIDLSNEIAQTYYRLSQLEKSAATYKKAPVNGQNVFNQGNIAFKNKDYQKAIDLYKKALKMNPNMPDARYNLTKAILEMKKNTPPPSQSSQNNSSNQNKNQKNDKDLKPQNGLSENSIDRILDQLMKNEADTRKKLSNKQSGNSQTNSSKKW